MSGEDYERAYRAGWDDAAASSIPALPACSAYMDGWRDYMRQPQPAWTDGLAHVALKALK